MNVSIVEANQCCGCAACSDVCNKRAIEMDYDEEGNRRPRIVAEKCVECGLCAKICPHINNAKTQPAAQQCYVGTYLDNTIASASSSGGAFVAIAIEVLKQHSGVVYGAAMVYENDMLLCKHIRVDDVDELYRLQGSKYMQSRTDGIFAKVKQDLADGRIVLFSGTSCQVAALYGFVGGKRQGLYTVDLVCHGVPKEKLWFDYLRFIEDAKHFKAHIVSFRDKKKYRILFDNKHSIIWQKSAYYSLFLLLAGYRENCYHCVYASMQKPSDITLGDFLPTVEDEKKYGFSSKEHYSSIIVNSDSGDYLWQSIQSKMWFVSILNDEMLLHHNNLRAPSAPTALGLRLFGIYNKQGFAALQKKINRIYIKNKIRNVVLRIKHLKMVDAMLRGTGALWLYRKCKRNG